MRIGCMDSAGNRYQERIIFSDFQKAGRVEKFFKGKNKLLARYGISIDIDYGDNNDSCITAKFRHINETTSDKLWQRILDISVGKPKDRKKPVILGEDNEHPIKGQLKFNFC